MTLSRSIIAVSALGLAVRTAFAEDYLLDEPGKPVPCASARAVPAAPVAVAPVAQPQAAANTDALFARFDANRDGAISWQEAQADPDLVRYFRDADRDANQSLTRAK